MVSDRLIDPNKVLAQQSNTAYRLGNYRFASALSSRIGMARNRFYGSRRGFNAFRIASRARQKAARSYTMNKRRRTKPSTGLGVTSQYDARLIYRRKPMPSRKRRSWKKFISKVHAVDEKDLGTQQVVFNAPFTVTQNSGTGTQLWSTFGLYGLKSSASNFNDLSNVAGFIAGATGTVTTGLPVGDSSKVIFKSAVLDMTIRNACTNNGVADSAARLELDIYECTMRHTAEETGVSYGTPDTVFDTNSASTLPIGGAGTTVEISTALRGTTPFDFSYALSRFGIRIEKKVKYTINNGDQITYQMRDPRRRSTTFKEIANQDGFNKPGWTRFVVLVGKLSPGLTVGAVGTPGTYQQVINVGCTRKYVFKIENYTEDRTAYLVA